MTPLWWLALAGTLLLATSFLSGWIHRGPVTTFAIYLVVGVLIGPGVFALTKLPLSREHIHWLHVATEAALVVSLFVTGLKLRLPLRDRGWLMALRLALPAMVLTAAGVAAVACLGLGWPFAAALAVAAVVSPTDPVLASLVSVDDARDDDPLRVALSGEAGLNDGTALPLLFLALALMEPGAEVSGVLAHWFTLDVLWELAGGLALGLLGGWGLGYVGTHLRYTARDVAPSDFLALGIMVVVYAASQLLEVSGFLAAFAAGAGLRRVELSVSEGRDDRKPNEAVERETPAEMRVNPNERSQASVDHPSQTVGWVVSDALSFGETVERLIAVALVLAVGITVIPQASWEGVLVAAVLLVVIRPLSTWIATIGCRVPWQRRLLIGWFGIRGLGSLNYMAFAVMHGLKGVSVPAFESVVLTVVAVSIVIHGVSVTPLMQWRERAIEAAKQRGTIDTVRNG
ncbi:sodium:proton antiporter [Luteibacter jiangsuensis]|uniref:Sodium:proton antiporter n=1 Tax=Luteibacter jiangsuensis TaxID=637577 RepID=A0ABX0Q7A4_9GAMM|nr:cation:proton antiporter [Luteibacter jiangsuensis]NID05840.1 sodium:proton antiporter [Luteibacter jiangsuensis]